MQIYFEPVIHSRSSRAFNDVQILLMYLKVLSNLSQKTKNKKPFVLKGGVDFGVVKVLISLQKWLVFPVLFAKLIQFLHF